MQTRFLNTVFLCSKFKLENIVFGSSKRLREKCLPEFLLADHCKVNRKNFVPHDIYLFQINGNKRKLEYRKPNE